MYGYTTGIATIWTDGVCVSAVVSFNKIVIASSYTSKYSYYITAIRWHEYNIVMD